MNCLEVDEKLHYINNNTSILVGLIPVNLEEEKVKFFESNNYNPQFKYKIPKKNFEKLGKELSGMQFDSSALGILFKQKRDQLLKKIELIKSIGKEDFTKRSVRLYGKPNKELAKLANNELNSYEKAKDSFQQISFEQTEEIFNNVLDRYDIADFKIRKSKIIADCICGKNNLRIRPDVNFSEDRVKKTIAHEIETHVFRARNGTNQEYGIFTYGTANYTFAEEGLAIFNESLVSSKNSEKNYWPAAYVLAVQKALELSFKEVFDFLRWHRFSKQRAWVITTKVKRGLCDTSKSGCFTKDYLYYEGREIIKKYVKKGGKISDLYVGKIGTEDIKHINKIKNIKKPIFIPDFIKKYEGNI